MKKLLFLLPIFALTLAACNRTQTQTASVSSPSPTASTAETQTETTNGTSSAELVTDGVMVGDSLMLPSKNLLQNATAASNLTTVVKAVTQAGLAETLQKPGPFTVFAPTNDAFEALPTETLSSVMKPENKSQLIRLLTYHVVPGEYTTKDFKDGMKLKTVQGQEILIQSQGGAWVVTDAAGTTARIETADVISNNGIAFVIDTVLSPQ